MNQKARSHNEKSPKWNYINLLTFSWKMKQCTVLVKDEEYMEKDLGAGKMMFHFIHNKNNAN